MKKISIILLVILLFSVISFGTESDIQLVVNGKNITSLSNPVIIDSRMMVPIKFVSDELNANVVWDGDLRSVRVTKDEKEMLLWIGSKLLQYEKGSSYTVSDVAPIIINSRTYVPLRLVSNAFGVEVKWDENSRTVFVDDKISVSRTPIYEVEFENIVNGQVVSEEINVELKTHDSVASEVQLLLMNPITAKGYVVGRSTDINSPITYLPKTTDDGDKVLVAAFYDSKRKLIEAVAVDVDIQVEPKITLTGEYKSVYEGSIKVSQSLNFLAHYINYEFTNLETGQVTLIEKRDPVESYSWQPDYKQSGLYSFRVIAYDEEGQAYNSNTLKTTFEIPMRLSLGGVYWGQTINQEISLIASRNYDVTDTEFAIRDPETGIESQLGVIPWGSFIWTPTEAYYGEQDLYVRVTDVNGIKRTSAPIRVTINGDPVMKLKGIGPKQVLTDDVDLSVSSNVLLESVAYILKDEQGNLRTLGEASSLEKINYSPKSSDEGRVSLYAQGIYKGQLLKTESVDFSIYMGTLYGSKPIVVKGEFKSFASDLAMSSFDKTGMSAALQTAQAILETGWGQYVPVDKYSGKFSYNLFGIKGSSSNGSVTSNTWEVYNGVSFRVDANFRAYNNVQESWDDHKRILLDLSRYAPYRAVMYDSTLAAYAVRRAGYATDPKYPMKLLDIIEKYDLKQLDEIGLE